MNEVMLVILDILEDYDLIKDKTDTNQDSFVAAVQDLDSLSYISIMVEIENRLNVSLPDEVLENNLLTDIQKLVGIVSSCKTRI